MMDARLRNDIREEFRKCMEGLQERWVTAETLSQHIETLRPRWLEKHGELLDRTRMEWTDEEGHHTTRWLYPLNKIKQMMLDGRIKTLGE